MIEVIGWIGALLLATCGLPQLIKTLRTRSFDGLSLTFVTWWLLGEVLTLAYVAYVAFRWPLIFNYGFNIAVCVIILTAYLFLRQGKKK